MTIIKRLFAAHRAATSRGSAPPAVTRDELIRLFAEDLGYTGR